MATITRQILYTLVLTPEELGSLVSSYSLTPTSQDMEYATERGWPCLDAEDVATSELLDTLTDALDADVRK